MRGQVKEEEEEAEERVRGRGTELTVVALNLSDGMLINKKSLNFSRRAERKTVDLSLRLGSMHPPFIFLLAAFILLPFSPFSYRAALLQPPLPFLALFFPNLYQPRISL